MSGDLVVRPASPLARRAQTPLEAKAQVQAAREQLKVRLEALERSLPSMPRWRETVKKHPMLTIGGLFVAGYLLGRWWGRR